MISFDLYTLFFFNISMLVNEEDKNDLTHKWMSVNIIYHLPFRCFKNVNDNIAEFTGSM